MSTERNEEHKDVEEYFNRVSKKVFKPEPRIYCRKPGETDKEFAMRMLGFNRTVETTARVVEDEPDRSVKLFNHMHHFVETGKVEG